MSKKTIYIIVAIVLVLAISGGIYYYYQNNQKNNTQNINTQGFGRANRNNAESLTTIKGKIISIKEKQITVEDDSGNQKIITLSDTTRLSKQEKVDKTTILKVDQSVSISTTKNGESLNAVKIMQMDLPNGANSSFNANRSRPDGQTPPDMRQGGGFAGQANNMLRGKITAINGNELTVQGFNNLDQKVMVDDKTEFLKDIAITISDLKVEQNIELVGSTSAGVLTARNLTVDL